MTLYIEYRKNGWTNSLKIENCKVWVRIRWKFDKNRRSCNENTEKSTTVAKFLRLQKANRDISYFEQLEVIDLKNTNVSNLKYDSKCLTNLGDLDLSIFSYLNLSLTFRLGKVGDGLIL